LKIISFSGGEPLVRYKFLKECIKLIYNEGIEVGLLTNGTLATRQALQELKNCGLHWVRYSLEGSTQEIHDVMRGEDTFNKVIESMRAAKELGLETHIRTTVTKLNVHDVENIILLARSLNVDTIDLRPSFMSPSEEVNEVFLPSSIDIISSLRKIFKLREEIGDEIEIKLLPLWFEFLLTDWDEKPVRRCKCGRGYLHIEPNLESAGVCKECRHWDICLGSCHAVTYNVFKSFEHVPPQCFFGKLEELQAD